MNVRTVSISKVALDPANVRTHDQRNLKAIEDSLRLFGQRKPIVVMKADDGFVVIAGNGTLEAARAIGWDEIAVAVVPEDWTSDEAAAYAIADNRTAELAAWDDAGLTMQLAELEAAGWDMETLGFETNGGLRADEVVEDDVPEPPADPVTKPGDLWLLGEHRVLCGDSTDPECVYRVMGGGVAEMLLTDPPYGLDRNLARAPGKAWRISNDNPDDAPMMYAALAAFDSAPERYVWGQWNTWGNLTDALGEPDNCIVWVKSQMGMGHGYRHRHEFLAYYGVKSFSDQSDVWEASRDHSGLHPTMKPVELCAKAITNSSDHGAIVADPFLGSGTTLIAAEQTGRICYGIELDPAYCDVIVQRWENLTGKKAVLAK